MSRPPESTDDLAARYARGDLDRVELEELESRASLDVQLQLQLEEAHDHRTAAVGLLSYVGTADLSECFSMDTLERFNNGTLSRRHRALVRGHLACPLCGVQVENLRRGARRARWSKRTTLVVASGLFAAAVVIAAILLRRPSDALSAYFEATPRPYEGRLSLEGLPFAPYDAHLSRAPKPNGLPLELLAALEKQGERRAMAAVYLRSGRPAESLELLKDDRSPDARSDRAAALLALGRAEDALAESEAAVKRVPDLSAARWNLALSLERMGLKASAAKHFRELATGDSAWALEAARRAGRMERAVREARSRYESAVTEAKRWATGGSPPVVDTVQDYPDLARRYFYEALAASPEPESQARLQPLARMLSSHFQDRALDQWLERSRSSPIRARLSAQLKRAIQKKPSKERLEVLLKKAEDASLPLLALEFARLLRVQRQRADGLLRSLPFEDRWLAATLMTWRGRSSQTPIPDLSSAAEAAVSNAQRAQARVRLGEAMIGVGDLASAKAQGQRALSLAIRSGDWAVTNRALLLRGSVAFQALRAAEALAYFEEVRARLPGQCPYQRYAVERIAQLWLYNRQPQRSLEALRSLGACKDKLSPLGALALSDSLRGVDAPKEERAWLDAQIERAVQSPGTRGLVGRYIEARDALPKEPKRAVALLEAFIRDSTKAARTNLSTREFRVRAFGLLALHQARKKSFAQALAHLASEANIAPPSACVLGALLDDDRRVVVALNAQGKGMGLVDERWRVPIGELEAEAVVPQRIASALGGCATVDVLALPPLWGAPRLLGKDLAWRYRKAPSAPIPRVAGSSRSLVVANPSQLVQAGWPALPRYESGQRDATRIEGEEATLQKVLEALPSASTIEFFTHGRFDPTGQLTDLVLTPSAQGRYLSARSLASIELGGAPTVFMGACYAGATPPNARRSTTLIEAFLEKGASGIVASNQQISAANWQRFITQIQNEQGRGVPLVQAVQKAKVSNEASAWLESVLVFTP